MIVGHHGGEAPLLQAVLAAAGTASIVLALFRVELSRLGRRFRLRPRNRSDETSADGARASGGEQ